MDFEESTLVNMVKTRSGSGASGDDDGKKPSGGKGKKGMKGKGILKVRRKASDAKKKTLDRMTDAQNDEFQRLLMAQFSYLFDEADPRHRDTKAKTEAWKQLAELINDLGDPGEDNSDFTAADMSYHFKNMRDQWTRLQKKPAITDQQKWLVKDWNFLAGHGRKSRSPASTPPASQTGASIPPASQPRTSTSTEPNPRVRDLTLFDMKLAVEQEVSENLAAREQDERARFSRYLLSESRLMTEENFLLFKGGG